MAARNWVKIGGIAFLLAISLVLGLNCGQPSGSGSGTPAFSWSQVGPQGGFIPAVRFHPTRAGVVWLRATTGPVFINLQTLAPRGL